MDLVRKKTNLKPIRRRIIVEGVRLIEKGRSVRLLITLKTKIVGSYKVKKQVLTNHNQKATNVSGTKLSIKLISRKQALKIHQKL